MGHSRAFEVLIVGGGPAGMAAAVAAAAGGRRVGVADASPAPGGQIWRGGPAKAETKQAARWFGEFQATGVEFLAGAEVFDQPQPGVLLANRVGDVLELSYEKLVIATGARERFLPFPGWTLPNVFGAGALQSLVESGFPIAGKRVAVAGSGPLLLAVAAGLRHRGADVRLVAEQAGLRRLAGFAVTLLARPGKLLQAIGYQSQLLGVRYATGCRPVAAEGETKLSAVVFGNRRRTWTVPCDYLACGFGLTANLELPMLVGCRLEDGAVHVDAWQETSVEGVFCAGESTGIGGVDLALIEGAIAGSASVGERDRAAEAFRSREKARRFARALERAFGLNDQLADLATPETIVCRCEDVTRGRLEEYGSWRAAKLATRCGMGPCQGRTCGSATEVLFGWKPESVRPPIFPTSLGSLARIGTLSTDDQE